MNPEYIHSRLEEKAEAFEGEELRSQVESVLDEEDVSYRRTSVGGLEQPRHKEYLYELGGDEESFELQLITYDGRPGRDDGSVEIRGK
ncbi:hypothetical protein ACK3SF_05530 [Candidatus Nanosalina sp. VS9-1]|uniref:hypothetical protein n=1 Tax=Candidatus Nanosalina sp. VS9-1 TaxID=3388566 RepID=UPI0039DF5993